MRGSSGRTRVVLLTHSLSRSGSARIALDVFQSLRTSVSICTAARVDGPLAGEFRQLGPVCVLPVGNTKSQIASARRMPFARLYLRLFRPDVVYVNTVAALPLLNTLGIGSIPVLLHVHELDSYLSLAERQTPGLLTDVPRRYIAVSEAVRNALARRGVPTERVSVIPAFIKPMDFGTSLSKERSTDSPFVIGGSGYASWQKGTILWLQMAAEIAKLLPNGKIRFVWVGVDQGMDSWTFQETARKLRVDHLVEFVPSTSTPIDYYKTFDVFALSSWEDSCPVAVLENMMLGKPVVCFAGSGGAVEELGDTGVVVSEFSPALMAEEIVKLMGDPERARRLGEAARRRVLEKFNAERLVPMIYEQIQIARR